MPVLLTSDDAAAIIAADYQTYLGRVPDAGSLVAWQGQLVGGLSEAAFIGDLAASPEAASDIGGFYQSVLGRSGSAGEIAGWQAVLPDAGLTAIRAAFAGSPEARADIAGLYQSLLGRSAAASEIDSWQNALAGGASLAAIRGGFADSAEAHGDIAGLYQTVLGRSAGPAEIAGWQQALAAGASFAAVRAAFAGSAEAQGDVAGLYQSVLGRAATAGELAAGETSLTTGPLAALRDALAGGPEAQATLSAAYQSVFGAAPAAPALAGFAQQLQAGASLAQLEFGFDHLKAAQDSTANYNAAEAGAANISTGPTLDTSTIAGGSAIVVSISADSLADKPFFIVKLNGVEIGMAQVSAVQGGSPAITVITTPFAVAPSSIEVDYGGFLNPDGADNLLHAAAGYVLQGALTLWAGGGGTLSSAPGVPNALSYFSNPAEVFTASSGVTIGPSSGTPLSPASPQPLGSLLTTTLLSSNSPAGASGLTPALLHG
jgi:hypothetical protein